MHKRVKLNLPYYTPGEIVVHNKPNDIWVSIHGLVYNLTPLIKLHWGQQVIKPLLAYAGKDISHLFDPETLEFNYRYHIISSLYFPFMPHGPLPGIKEEVPSTKWTPPDDEQWWHPNSQYVIGYVTERARKIRMLNVLTGTENTLTVCKEDKLSRILERQLLFNSHIRSYTWKFETRVLDMNKTLEENKIPDYRDEFKKYGQLEDEYIPAIMLYYNDDLTEL
ncbi:cytochrome b5 domain-containing protein 1 [Anabrus simplex]|uniref:cytochrome b5 domain-containing protein 1 n=1 Tax=Anabrus simplex TaxID=316456 RepID=UPI0034DDBC7C